MSESLQDKVQFNEKDNGQERLEVGFNTLWCKYKHLRGSGSHKCSVGKFICSLLRCC